MDSVVHVDICTRQWTSNCVNYFTNAVELTIRHSNTRDSSVIMGFDRILCLKRLVKLIIECYNFPFEQLIKLLSFTPNLNSLKFKCISFDTSNLKLIQESDTFTCVSKVNHIACLDVHENCTLEAIQMINSLFRQLECLKTGFSDKHIEQVADLFYHRRNHQLSGLCCLCISYTSNLNFVKIIKLIESAKLMDNCYIYSMNCDVHIWW